MGLSLNQLQQVLKESKNRTLIAKAERHEKRVRLHSESAIDHSIYGEAVTEFLQWVKSMLPKDKYNTFISLMRFPIPTVELSESIFDSLERVYQGRNPVNDCRFTDIKWEDDWEWYRSDKLKLDTEWKRQSWDTLRHSFNSILIVDTPKESKSGLPEPYYYFLSIEAVHDFKVDDKGSIEFLAYDTVENKRIIIDDEAYYVYGKTDKASDPYILEHEASHDLGYCPATFFWDADLKVTEKGVKKSPLSKQLGNLDWLLFFSISKRHLDTYAAYPIYSSYEAECDYVNSSSGDYCDGGFLRREGDDSYVTISNGGVSACPRCSEKRLVGPGSYIDVPIPEDGEVDLRDPVTITPADLGSLKYNVEETERLTDKIFNSVVGYGEDGSQDTSLSDLQVRSGYENRVNILNNIKANLEKSLKFVIDTVCRLRYGKLFLESSISLGTEFYIYTIEDLQKQYKEAKASGASEARLDSISDMMVATEHRNNPNQLQRMLILKHLEPYRHFSLTELIQLNSSMLVDPTLLTIKINFNTFVNRFERENMNIIEWGLELEFSKKINKILEQFKKYADEISNTQRKLDESE